MPTQPLLDQKNTYEIRVKGHVDSRRIRVFEDATVTHRAGGETSLCGIIQDQAALYGILNRLRDLGIALVSVQQIKD